MNCNILITPPNVAMKQKVQVSDTRGDAMKYYSL